MFLQRFVKPCRSLFLFGPSKLSFGGSKLSFGGEKRSFGPSKRSRDRTQYFYMKTTRVVKRAAANCFIGWSEKNGPLGRRSINRLRGADEAASTPMTMSKAAAASERAADQLLMNNVRGYKKRKRRGRSVLFLCALQDGLEPTTP